MPMGNVDFIDAKRWMFFFNLVMDRSMSRVARKMACNASVVKRNVDALEKELGVVLFRRSTKSCEPTEAAVRLFDELYGEFCRFNSTFQSALDASLSEQAKELSIVTVSGLMGFVVEAVDEFRRGAGGKVNVKTYDDLRLPLSESPDLILWADFEGSLEGFDYEYLGRIPSWVCVSKDYALTRTIDSPADLKGEALVFSSNWICPFKLIHQETSNTFVFSDEDVCVRVSNLGLMKEFALRGAGVAMGLPAYAAAKAVEKGLLRRLLPEWTGPVLRYHLLINKNSRMKAYAFSRFLVEFWRDSMRGLTIP